MAVDAATTSSSIDEVEELYNYCINALLLGIPIEDFHKRFTWRHLMIVVNAIFLILNIIYCFHFALFSYDSLLELLNWRLYLSNHLAIFIIQWLIMLYKVDVLKEVKLQTRYFRCITYLTKEKYELIDKRNKLFAYIVKKHIHAHVYFGLCYLLTPFYHLIIDHIKGVPLRPLCIFPVHFPFEFKYSVILYIEQSILTCVLLMFYVMIFHWSLIGTYLINTQVKVMEFAITLDGNNRGKIVPVKEFLKDHQQLLKNVATFLEVFKLVMTCFMCLVVYSFSSATFLMANSDEFDGRVLSSLIFGFPALYIKCYLGSEISSSLERISRIIYQSQWYTMSADDKKTIICIMRQAQNASVPKVVFDMMNHDLTLFVDIVKFCYACYNLLTFFN